MTSTKNSKSQYLCNRLLKRHDTVYFLDRHIKFYTIKKINRVPFCVLTGLFWHLKFKRQDFCVYLLWIFTGLSTSFVCLKILRNVNEGAITKSVTSAYKSNRIDVSFCLKITTMQIAVATDPCRSIASYNILTSFHTVIVTQW